MQNRLFPSIKSHNQYFLTEGVLHFVPSATTNTLSTVIGRSTAAVEASFTYGAKPPGSFASSDRDRKGRTLSSPVSPVK